VTDPTETRCVGNSEPRMRVGRGRLVGYLLETRASGDVIKKNGKKGKAVEVAVDGVAMAVAVQWSIYKDGPKWKTVALARIAMNDSELHRLRAMTPALVLMIALVLTHATVISVGTGPRDLLPSIALTPVTGNCTNCTIHCPLIGHMYNCKYNPMWVNC